MPRDPFARWFAALGVSVLLSCGAELEPPEAARGAQLYSEKCAACHGADAKGGGAASLGLGVVPPDLTQFRQANDGVFPRDDIITAIDGYYRQTHLRDPMPIFGDEDLGPTVLVEENGVATPIPEDLLALAVYLETLQE